MTSTLDELIATRPVFDAHVDSLQRSLDMGHDLGVAGPGHLDLVRGARGGLAAVVLVAWVEPAFIAPELGGARARTVALLRELHRLTERHPDVVRWAGDGAGLDRARADGVVAGIPGIEGGHSIEESLANLEWFFERGVRVMTLVWNNHLSWIRSCHPAGAGVPAGLSDFGREVVATMNRLGMVVDLSHAGEQSFRDALEVTDKPVIASHSGCKRIHDHPRNLDDDQLRALRDQGGVVGMVFCTPFLDAAARAEENALRESDAFRAIAAANTTELWLAQAAFLQREATPLPIARLLDHALHAIEVCGVDHVGIGSDYDGVQRVPAGLEDASCYPNLAAALLDAGLSTDDVRKVLGGNMERVFRAATGPGTRAHGAALVRIDA